MLFTTRLLGSVLLISLSGCTGNGLQFKNDVFAGTDRDFTNGFSLSYAQNPDKINHIQKQIVDFIPVGSDLPLAAVVTTLRQDMYTPNDLRAKEIIEEQNPYAGSLTLGFKKVVADESSRHSTEIRLGTSGEPSLAGQTQTFVHDTLTDLGRSQTHPEGWHNQIEAEPLFNLEHRRSWETLRSSYGYAELVSVSQLAASAGNILTGAQVNHGYALGHNVPNLDRSNVINNYGVYIFGDLFGAGTLHNLYYDGGLFRESPHTVESTSGHIGVDVGAGVEYNNYSLKFHYITRSKTFREQNDNFHSFGFLSFGVEW